MKFRIFTIILTLGFGILSCEKNTSEQHDNPLNGRTTLQFNPTLTYGEITDIEGNVYKTIKIGHQTWMAENLRTTLYNDSTPIPVVTGNTEWVELESGAYCNLKNTTNLDSIATYGRLYNFYAVKTGKLAPKGWRIPTKTDFEDLVNYLGGYNLETFSKLCEGSSKHWMNTPGMPSDNESGFSAIVTGYRKGEIDYYNNPGVFAETNYQVSYWSSTDGAWGPYSLDICKAEIGAIGINYHKQKNGFVVRCILDDMFNNITYGSVADIDGNNYKTVTVGAQTWMAENLKTTKLNDGTKISKVTDNTEWKNTTTPGYTFYENNEQAYKQSYGALYNWYTVSTDKLCPSGWHVSTDEEWETLNNYMGSVGVADKLKESGSEHWIISNENVTNEIGFTALPGGYRSYDGTFQDINAAGYWWCNTYYQTGVAGVRYMESNHSTLYKRAENKWTGYSIRCVKNK